MLAVASVPSYANPIPNGDFEKEDNGSLAFWQPRHVVPTSIPNNLTGSQDLSLRFVWDTVSHGNGKGSLRIECLGRQGGGKGDTAFGGIDSPADWIKVQPETEYKLSWLWKSEGVSTKSFVSVAIFCQSPGPVAAPPNGSKFLKFFGTDKKVDTKDWEPGSMTFKTPPETGWIHLRIEATSPEPAKQFKVWIDDFTITKADGTDVDSLPKNPDSWTPRGAPLPSDTLGLGGFNLPAPPIPYGARIQRTMKLLATSTPEHRNRVKILFYGQSIIAQNWWKSIVADLRERYPNADIVAENPSIGGFMSPQLKDTMYADCYPANADLICFHDYGSDTPEMEQMMEEMFANMHRLTTAEVMPFTHHISWIGNPMHQRGDDRDSEHFIQWSAKYGFEPVDIRTSWKSYLDYKKSTGKEFLKDIIHLAPTGESLWYKITMPHFTYLPATKPYWSDSIKVYTPDGKRFAADEKREYPVVATTLVKPLKLAFEGNRVDVLGAPMPGANPGTANILIDGKAPSAFPELYYATRGSRPPNFFQPMIRRAQVGKDPKIEVWTFTFSKMSKDGTDFEYEVKGSITGPDGKGNAKEKFVSNSGRLILDPQWFWIANLVKGPNKGAPYPDGTSCTVSVCGNFMDVWKPQPAVAATPNGQVASISWNGFGSVMGMPRVEGSEDRYTLASGLANGPHTLEILPNGDGPLGLRAIVVYSPPKE